MYRSLLAVFLCVISFLTFDLTHAQIANIQGAAGRVEFWHPLNSSPRRGVLFIVTHHSAGPHGSGRNTARSQSGGKVGAEWWVLADGTILHSDRERQTGHCGANRAPGVNGDCNARSVGIEMEGFGNLTQQQVRSGLALIRFLQERYCIQSKDVHPHLKAPGEGVALAQAARSMGHVPACDGSMAGGSISDDVVSGAVNSSQNLRGQSLLGPTGQPYQYSAPAYSPSYQQPGVGGANYITGQPNSSFYAPPTPATQPTKPSVQSLLNNIAYPSLAEGEGDAVTAAESKKMKQLQDTDLVTIVNGSSTVTVVPLSKTKTETTATSTPQKYGVGSTFFSNELRAPVQSSVLSLGTQTILNSMKAILEKIRFLLDS